MARQRVCVEAETRDLQLELPLGPIADQDGVQMWWLGQAGFLLRSRDASLIIDPYLSDSLATKYRGKEFAHERMMPVPVPPAQLRGLTDVLITHGHSDHLDPGTVPGLAAASPQATFVVPRSCQELAIERGAPRERLQTIDAGETIEAPIPITALASAHERTERDEAGHHRFLGYVFELAGIRFYHSGDTVRYPGLARRLRRIGADVALLPINGRDSYRSSRGVPGNLTLEESLRLASDARARYVVCHHFGMFAFNTADTNDAQKRLRSWNSLRDRGRSEALLPEIGVRYRWRREPTFGL